MQWISCCSVVLYFLVLTSFISIAAASIPDFCSREHQFWCEKSDRCIAISQKCDGHVHCQEGEDEDQSVCQGSACNATNAATLDKFYCAGTQTCINLEWVCDGFPDCAENLAEDEDASLCDKRDCSDGQFRCEDGKCIDEDWKCDGQKDCDGGEDEKTCSTECKATEFKCEKVANASSKCIAKRWRCDGERDCEGGQDELDCAKFSCHNGYFRCGDEEKCIPDRWKCDGDFDCPQNEDEMNCNVKPPSRPDVICTSMEFTCESGDIPCILGPWECDGSNDCLDGSDESHCVVAEAKCEGGEFLCQADNRCIPGQLKCSGKSECSDGEDERDCSRYCDIRKGEFECSPTHPYGSSCISVDKVCDGSRDCGDGLDEDDRYCSDAAPQDLCDALHDNCGNEDGVICSNVFANNHKQKVVGRICNCNKTGFQYMPYNKTCQDVNECESEEAVCDQICINAIGNYTCQCNLGYELQHDRKTCKVKGVHPTLLFTNRHQIRSLHFHEPLGEYLPLVNSKTAVAIDFDYSERKVFFSDMTERKIYTFVLPSDGQEAEPKSTALNIDGIQTPDGLAYDWVYKHLYWTDTASNTINMADMKNLNPNTKPTERTLYANSNPDCVHHSSATSDQSTGDQSTEVCIDEPRALVIHPQKGWIFWSDWGSKPNIVMAALDGTESKKLVYNTDDRMLVRWPNGLALDLVTEGGERLYWIDAKLNSVFSCSLSSCMRDAQLLTYDLNNIGHPFSITVFESQLFWSDWHKRMIVSANKFTGENIKQVLTNLERPMDLKVFHPITQPAHINRCANLTEEQACQYLCVPKPWKRASGTDVFKPSSQPTRHTCLCPKGFSLNVDKRTCSEDATTVPSTTPAATDRLLSNSQSNKSPQVATKGHPLDVGVIAAIAASTVGAIVIIIILLVLVVLRRIKRNKSKNMNFENPIYKRTTEDKLELPRHEYQPSSTVPSVMVPLTAPESQASTSSLHDCDA